MVNPSDVLVGALAVTFVVVNGSNDGAALVACGLSIRALAPGVAIALSALAVALVPAVVGTRVATTLADRMVSFGEQGGRAALASAVAASLLVVGVLIRLRLPTSMTVAIVGGIAGAGVGAGLEVGWGTIALVLGLAVAAPLLGFAIALAAMRLVQLRGATSAPAARRLRRGHIVGYCAQAVAYGVNDAQKMYAVTAVLFAASSDPVLARPLPSLAIAGGFAAGAVIGLPRQASTVATGVLALRPLQTVVGEFATEAAVIGTGLLGAPVSSTQTMLGALVGTGVSQGSRRVRWRIAAQLLVAWAITMPAAFVVGLALGAVTA
ncbi:MAG: inorganic phosphate transporter [Actinomycetota bacterium]